MKAETMFLRISSSASASSNIKSGFMLPPPTTDTAMARRSLREAAAASASLSSPASRASPTKYSTLASGPANSLMRSFVAASVFSVRPMIMTAAPSRANQAADAPPIPPPPPVTSAA